MDGLLRAVGVQRRKNPRPRIAVDLPAMIEMDRHFYGLPDNSPAIPLSFSPRAVKE